MTAVTGEIRSAPKARRGSRLVVSATFVRVGFFLVYFTLNAMLAADKTVVLLTVPTLLVCCYNVWRIKGAYATVEDMIWLVIFLYFVIAPCQTLGFGYLDAGPASGIFFAPAEIFEAFAIIFVFVLVATLTSGLVLRLARAAEPQRFELKTYSLAILVPLNLFAFAMFVVTQGGLGGVLADRYSKEQWTVTTSVAMDFQILSCLLIWVYARCMPLRTRMTRMVVYSLTALALGLLLVSFNPFNSARFVLIIAWLPMLLVFNSGKMSIKPFFLSVLFGLVVLMPVLNETTRHGSSLTKAIESIDSSSLIKIPGLDVFDMLLFEVRYLQASDYYWGSKTLGLALFFVPRELWTGKATVVAGDMGEKLADWGTTGTANLSNFVAGDFYADLGMVGVAIGAAMTSFLLTFFGNKRRVFVHGLDLRAFIFWASVPILIRGTLAAVLSLTFLDLVYLAVLTRALGRRRRQQQRPLPPLSVSEPERVGSERLVSAVR